MKKYTKIIFTSLSASLLLLSIPEDAQAKKFNWKFWKKPVPEVQTDTVKAKKPSKYDKLFKNESAKAEGLFTLHMVKGKVYFEVPESLLGREFVMGSTVKSISENENGVVGAKPTNDLVHFTLVKVDSTVQMRSVSTNYLAADSNIEKAMAMSQTSAVMKAFPVKAVSNDSTAVVFDATDLFLKHDKDMSPFLKTAVYASYDRKETFKPELSYIEGVKAFEDNVSVTSSLSYTYTMKNERTGKTYFEDRPFTAVLTRSIMLLPEKPYHPRMADYRIGVFFTGREQMGSTTSSSKDVYFANRWRVEPSDTAAYRRGELVEPVKPIVYYIDSNFPEWWKPYIVEAVEQWNEPFEKIGFKNVVKALPFPTDDPQFDPDNIKYSCVRYAPIGVQNAMGPSWVDPRSGEIINASVYVYHDIVKLITRWRFVQTAQADPDVRASELPREVLGDAIRYVISHEIGHTLGFMHNMGASATVPVEMLRDPQFTSETGTTPSIMDYARFNYVAQPGDKERGVKLTPPRFGKYDEWLIKWTYTPVFDAESLEQEAEITSGWISDALKQEPWHRYGKQQFSSIFFDPRSQNEDLGDDAVAASKYGVANLKYIMANFMDWLSEGDEEYEFRTAIYEAIINQYLTYANHVAMNVGGLYKNEIKVGDTMPRYANVPAAKQKEALAFLFTMWEDLDWMCSDKVVGCLPIVGTPAQAVRNALEGILLQLPFMCGYSDGVTTKEFSSTDCITAVVDKAFEATRKGKALSPSQRLFQQDIVNTYMSAANFAIPGAKKSFAVSEDAHPTDIHFFCSADEDQNCFGELMYSPVSGYEWMPRYIFNRGDVSASTVYGQMMRIRGFVKARIGSANAADKAHYQVLLNTIDYSLKTK